MCTCSLQRAERCPLRGVGPCAGCVEVLVILPLLQVDDIRLVHGRLPPVVLVSIGDELIRHGEGLLHDVLPVACPKFTSK